MARTLVMAALLALSCGGQPAKTADDVDAGGPVVEVVNEGNGAKRALRFHFKAGQRERVSSRFEMKSTGHHTTSDLPVTCNLDSQLRVHSVDSDGTAKVGFQIHSGSLEPGGMEPQPAWDLAGTWGIFYVGKRGAYHSFRAHNARLPPEIQTLSATAPGGSPGRSKLDGWILICVSDAWVGSRLPIEAVGERAQWQWGNDDDDGPKWLATLRSRQNDRLAIDLQTTLGATRRSAQATRVVDLSRLAPVEVSTHLTEEYDIAQPDGSPIVTMKLEFNTTSHSEIVKD